MSSPTILLHTTRTRGLGRIHAFLRRLGRSHAGRIKIGQSGTNIIDISTPREVHWIWNSGKRPTYYDSVRNLPNVYFLENGWFNPHHAFQLDRIGVNARGSIPHSITSDSPNDESGVRAFIHRLHRTMNAGAIGSYIGNRNGYIFLPLQCEHDTQILHDSCCGGGNGGHQIWAVDQICRQFPDQQIIIRPHPKDPKFADVIRRKSKGLREHPAAEITHAGNTYQWLKHARAVVGINSTVLTEALTFYKPVAMLGKGILTGNGVSLDCCGNAGRLAEVLDYIPNRKRINQLLTLLRMRQILYTTPTRKFREHPVLIDAIKMAYHCATLG